MPSKTVYLNVSGLEMRPSQYELEFFRSNPPRIYVSSREQVSFDEYYEEIIFNSGKIVKDHLPENTRLVSLTLNYYYRYSYKSPFLPTYYFGDARDEYSNGVSKSLNSSSSFNRASVTFSVNEINEIERINKIKVIYNSYNDFQNEFNGESPYFSHSRVDDWWNTIHEYYNIPKSLHFMIKNHDASSSYKPYLTINYEHNPPVAPTSLVPDNSTENPRTPIRFTWNSRINQIAFQLQYQVDGGSWTTVSQTTDNRFYELPAGTITATEGTVNWLSLIHI